MLVWISPSTGSGPEGFIMKLIKAIIKPERFEIVKKSLEVKGITGMTVTEVQGRGEQKGITLEYRGKPMVVDMLPKTQIELIVRDSEVDDLVTTIMKSARTGKIGDGKIFILPVETAIRVRTGEMEHENASGTTGNQKKDS
jgi:nitrogen regulatory protein P-II 1